MTVEASLSADRGEVLHVSERDVLRVDRHRAERAVGRRIVGRCLGDRQELQQALSGAREPRRHSLDVADLTDAPTARGRHREQRHQNACAAISWPERHEGRIPGNGNDDLIIACARSTTKSVDETQRACKRVGELIRRRNQADDDERLVGKVEEIPGMHQHAFALEQFEL